MDALCFGVILGCCEHEKISWPFQCVNRFPLAAIVFTFVALAIPVFLPFSHWLTHSFGLSLLAIASTIWTAHAVAHPDWTRDRALYTQRGARLLSLVGVYSYTVYLVQNLVNVLIGISKQLPATAWFMNSHGPQIIGFWAGCLGLGWCLAAAIERPCLALRDRLYAK
jgi:hypothetical protein